MASTTEDWQYLSPAGAPPLLNQDQLLQLCLDGWLNLELPARLEHDIDVLQTTASDFFAQQEDLKLELTYQKHPQDEGYYLVPEEKEYITFRREMPMQTAVQDHIRRIWPQVAAFLHRILCDLSTAGGLDPAAWDAMIESALVYPDQVTSLRDSPTLLRVFRYDPGTGTAEKHTDLGLLTLCVGTGAGLEVLNQSQQPTRWEASQKCTVLVGETLRRLARDGMRAGSHRVVANPVGRQSFVFALRPDLSVTVDLEQFGGCGVVNMRDLFTSIKGRKYNVNARPAERQQQRQQQHLHDHHD